MPHRRPKLLAIQRQELICSGRGRGRGRRSRGGRAWREGGRGCRESRILGKEDRALQCASAMPASKHAHKGPVPAMPTIAAHVCKYMCAAAGKRVPSSPSFPFFAVHPSACFNDAF
eukprot:359061-Chlamydomonas_euryale.AAC.2